MTSKLVRARVVLAAALAATALSLTACGSSGDKTAATSAPVATPAAVATTESTGCDNGAADAVKQAVTSPAVQKIQVIGGCSMVSIETSLGSTARADAQKICDAASKVAYTGTITSVSVDGADGHELSAGLKNAPCI